MNGENEQFTHKVNNPSGQRDYTTLRVGLSKCTRRWLFCYVVDVSERFKTGVFIVPGAANRKGLPSQQRKNLCGDHPDLETFTSFLDNDLAHMPQGSGNPSSAHLKREVKPSSRWISLFLRTGRLTLVPQHSPKYLNCGKAFISAKLATKQSRGIWMPLSVQKPCTSAK